MERPERGEKLANRERKSVMEGRERNQWASRLEQLKKREQQLAKYDAILRAKEEEWKNHIREREDELMERVTEWRLKVAAETERIRQEQEQLRKQLESRRDEELARMDPPEDHAKEEVFKELRKEFSGLEKDWKTLSHWLEENDEFKLIVEGWRTMGSQEFDQQQAQARLQSIIDQLKQQEQQHG